MVLKTYHNSIGKVALYVLFGAFASITLPFLVGVAKAQTTDWQAEESIYRYNALESRLSYSEIKEIRLANGTLEEGMDADEVKSELESLKNDYSIVKTELDEEMEKMGSSRKVKTILAGQRVGMLKMKLVELEDVIAGMYDLENSTNNKDAKAEIDQQIKIAESEQIKVENFISEQENKFSLLGWFVGIL